MDRHQPPNNLMIEVVRTAFRHKWKAIFFFLFVMITVTAATLFLPKTYRSESKLFVRLGRENTTLDPTDTLGRKTIFSMPPSREAEINSAVEILRSRVLLKSVVDAIGPEKILQKGDWRAPSNRPSAPKESHEPSSSPSSSNWQQWATDINLVTPLDDHERAIHELEQRVHVDSVRNSNLIAVAYEGQTPTLSQSVVSALVDSYLEKYVQMHQTAGGYDLLSEQTKRLHDDLVQAEEKLQVLENEAKIISPKKQRELIVTRQARLEDEILKTRAKAAASEVQVSKLREEMTDLPDIHITAEVSGRPDTGLSGILAQHHALQLAEQKLLTQYKETHPKVQAIKQQVAAAKKLLQKESRTYQEVTKGPNLVYEEVQKVLFVQEPLYLSLQAKDNLLQKQLAQVNEELKALNNDELLIAQSQRNVEILDANYRQYATALEQVRIDEARRTQRLTNISVVQPATWNPKPIRPNKLFNLLLGLAVGLIGGLGLALIFEQLDHSFHTSAEIETELGLPVLVSLPRMKQPMPSFSPHEEVTR